MKHVVVLNALESVFLRDGLTKIIHSLKQLSATVVEMEGGGDAIDDKIETLQPAVVFVEPLFFNDTDLDVVRQSTKECKIIGLTTAALPERVSKKYDQIIGIYDSKEAVELVFKEILSKKADEQKELSPREKEIVIGIVKGLSNKEIAAENNISVHTVMTHRKNIAAKLQIHSVAGLTVYAIVSKLVRLDDIKV